MHSGKCEFQSFYVCCYNGKPPVRIGIHFRFQPMLQEAVLRSANAIRAHSPPQSAWNVQLISLSKSWWKDIRRGAPHNDDNNKVLLLSENTSKSQIYVQYAQYAV